MMESSCHELMEEIKAIFNKIGSSGSLSLNEKIILYQLAGNLAFNGGNDECKRLKSNLPQTGQYIVYPGRLDSLEWLEKHWGKYLKKFNKDKDFIFQDQLRRLDPNLMKAVENQCCRNGLKVKDFIAPKKERTDMELAIVGEYGILNAARLAIAKQRRSLSENKKSSDVKGNTADFGL